ncbi:hypothetical protein SAMN05421821_105150 [Mucilaginibacter lappiensis]|uniref:Uncharacterized protein n=1 Tax=Mucilaginibacter lappiensis TaxID=354630 RepID=A0ABR6PIY0_9SPHI|nr:hypothetical protein [Mucilaginibacter lappiensis]MBB6109732.1 hypothetical protein [Mucilaginibacter lappiensis]SIR13511.1 hypothetical protein SAMN05421821_105150 [Mucilaginibacter lappiensis]
MIAQDLRLGNIVKGITTDYCKVYSISYDDVSGIRFHSEGSTSSTWSGGKGIEPVELTEDWLIKFGLSKDEASSNGSVRYNFRYQRLTINLHSDGEHPVFFEGNCITWVMFVHQLQNLYFVLTGEELTMQL